MAMNVVWRMKHITDGDKALETASAILATQYHTDDAIARANALIALGRAHYRAVEVDLLTRNS